MFSFQTWLIFAEIWSVFNHYPILSFDIKKKKSHTKETGILPWSTFPILLIFENVWSLLYFLYMSIAKKSKSSFTFYTVKTGIFIFQMSLYGLSNVGYITLIPSTLQLVSMHP